jgi:hypothetical protein
METFSFSPASLFTFLMLASRHTLTEHEITAVLRRVRRENQLVTVAGIERHTAAVVDLRMFSNATTDGR